MLFLLQPICDIYIVGRFFWIDSGMCLENRKEWNNIGWKRRERNGFLPYIKEYRKNKKHEDELY